MKPEFAGWRWSMVARSYACDYLVGGANAAVGAKVERPRSETAAGTFGLHGAMSGADQADRRHYDGWAGKGVVQLPGGRGGQEWTVGRDGGVYGRGNEDGAVGGNDHLNADGSGYTGVDGDGR